MLRSTGFIAASLLAPGLAGSAAVGQDLQLLGDGVLVRPVRAMSIAVLPDGRVVPQSGWIQMPPADGGAGVAALASNLNDFDAFENDGGACGDGVPAGGDSCGLPDPRSRWFFGPSYCSVELQVGEIRAEGTDPATRLQFAWYWTCGGSGTEPCYIPVLTGDVFDPDCGGASLIGGVVFDFGELTCNPGGYYFTDIDLRDAGLSIMTYAQGGVAGVLAKGYDGERFELATCGQFMLWGSGPDLCGDHGGTIYVDQNGDGRFTPDECGSLDFGICPDPLHWMVGLGDCPPDCCEFGTCQGGERLKASARTRDCGCRVKAVIVGALPGADYAVTLPSGACVKATANNRGKVKVLECPGVSGSVEVPACGLTRDVVCP